MTDLSASPRRHRHLGRLLLVFAMAAALTAAPAADATKKEFNIPAGRADVALKQFSAQSGTAVIFAEDAIEGTRTNALKGAFTPADALDRLLSGTNLKAAHDAQSGAFAVNRTADRPKETSPPNG